MRIKQAGLSLGGGISWNDFAYYCICLCHTKVSIAENALNHINICLKHAAALGLNVNLQATTKALSSLETKMLVLNPFIEVLHILLGKIKQILLGCFIQQLRS
ncbi:hypothetical protein [Bartonella rattimassiliensis]|uniref:Uncharacterized protein n=1 Tax=Bartonella rattimassiliensis 15908 TaxID=1094556 RepID=J1JNQ4_9HYPH|nr:hypothetical protein [Bartonella rattimassiliensis]EJF85920.1 hypothetical protein MCY_00934 [Bartonella rattimassiliensis 15908]